MSRSLRKTARGMAVAAVLAAVVAAGAGAGTPRIPKAANGAHVTVLARGVPTPTSFAFVGSSVLVGAYGDETDPTVGGGVYLVQGGKAIQLPGSPEHAFGLVWHAGTLYVSAGQSILAWSGWNGSSFATVRTVVTEPDDFTGFTGLAWGPDGLLYTGVAVGQNTADDHTHGTTPYANDVLSVDPATGAIKVVAQGLRNPWQLAFVRGHKGPLVTDVAQDNLGDKRPPDRIDEAVAGSNFGFPNCPARPTTCAKYTKPFALFPAHSSAVGLAQLGNKLYVSLLIGTGKGPEVVSMPIGGGPFKPFLTGYPSQALALGVYGGRVYSGDVAGAIYSVKG